MNEINISSLQQLLGGSDQGTGGGYASPTHAALAALPGATVTPDQKIYDPSSIQGMLSASASQAFGADQVAPLLNIVKNESGFNPQAANQSSTARGLFQMLDSTAKSYGLPADASTATVQQQINAGMKYIKERYGNPANAWQFWQETDPAKKNGFGGNWY